MAYHEARTFLHATLHANLEICAIPGIREKRKSLFPWILGFSGHPHTVEVAGFESSAAHWTCDECMSFRRTLLMQPEFRLYRESYDTAKKSNDAFAARFHLNLFPRPEQIRIQAETILAALFDRLILSLGNDPRSATM